MGTIDPNIKIGVVTKKNVFVIVGSTNDIGSSADSKRFLPSLNSQANFALSLPNTRVMSVAPSKYGRNDFINLMKSKGIEYIAPPTDKGYYKDDGIHLTAKGEAWVRASFNSRIGTGNNIVVSGASVGGQVSNALSGSNKVDRVGVGGLNYQEINGKLNDWRNGNGLKTFLSKTSSGTYAIKTDDFGLILGDSKYGFAQANKALAKVAPEDAAAYGQKIDEFYKNDEKFKRDFLEAARANPERAKEFASLMGCPSDRAEEGTESQGTDVNQLPANSGTGSSPEPAKVVPPVANSGICSPSSSINLADTPVCTDDGKRAGQIAKENAEEVTDTTTVASANNVSGKKPGVEPEPGEIPENMEKGELSAPSFCEDVMSIETKPASRVRTATPRTGAALATSSANMTGANPLSKPIMSQAFNKGMGGFLQKIMGMAKGMGAGGGGGGDTTYSAFTDESAKTLAELIEAQKKLEEAMGNSSLAEYLYPDYHDGYSPFFDGGPNTQYRANLKELISQKLNEKSPINLKTYFCLLFYGDFTNVEIITTSNDTKNLYNAFSLKAIELGLEESGNTKFTADSIVDVLLFSMKFATGYQFPFINIDKFKGSILTQPRSNSKEEVIKAVTSDLKTIISDDNAFYRMHVFSYFLYGEPFGEDEINNDTLLKSYFDRWVSNLNSIGDIRPGVDYTVDQYITASIKSFEALF